MLPILIVLLAPSAAAAQVQESYTSDAHGHAFQTSFDRHNRLELAAGTTLSDEGSAPTLGAGFRLAFSADFPDEEVWWQLRHQVLNTQFSTTESAWQTRVSLLKADYLRHDISSWITVPGDADLRIPGPFDIVVRWELAAATFAVENPTEVLLWEVFELDFLLDFIRDEAYRHRLAVGVTADYHLVENVRHELTPMSAATVLYGWEAASGLFAAHVEGRFGRQVMLTSSDDASWSTIVATTAHLEWTPIAINDNPLAFYSEAQFKALSSSPTSWQVFLGARFSL
jgi:hypothetical protein